MPTDAHLVLAAVHALIQRIDWEPDVPDLLKPRYLCAQADGVLGLYLDGTIDADIAAAVVDRIGAHDGPLFGAMAADWLTSVEGA